MDILIKGMEMPKERKMFVIEPDGSVWIQIADTSYFCTGSKAVALPEHGRLGDLDLVEEWMRIKHKEHDCPFDIDAFLFALRKIPTIVEASNGTDN